MRRAIRGVLLALAALLLAAGVCAAVRDSTIPAFSAGEGSAALGLVLLDDAERVYVLAVSDQSPAHLAGIEPGDYILKADDRLVADAAMLDEALEAGGDQLVLTILRQEREMKLSLPRR